jgi:hypothetical protein
VDRSRHAHPFSVYFAALPLTLAAIFAAIGWYVRVEVMARKQDASRPASSH